MFLRSSDAPSNLEELPQPRLLLQLPLNLRDQLLTLHVYLILPFEQRPPLLVALRFEGLDLPLASERFLQRERGSGRAATAGGMKETSAVGQASRTSLSMWPPP